MMLKCVAGSLIWKKKIMHGIEFKVGKFYIFLNVLQTACYWYIGLLYSYLVNSM